MTTTPARSSLSYAFVAVPWLVASAVAVRLASVPSAAAQRPAQTFASATIAVLIACGAWILMLPSTTGATRRALGHASSLLAPFCAVLAARGDGPNSIAFVAACVCALGATVATGWRGVLIGVLGTSVVTFVAPMIAGHPPSMVDLAYGAAILATVTVLPVAYIVRSLQRATMRTLSELPAFATAAAEKSLQFPPVLLETRTLGESEAAETQTRTEALARYLRQVRDTLGVTDAVFWRATRRGGTLVPVAWASDSGGKWEAGHPTLGDELISVQSASRVALFDRAAQGLIAAVSVTGSVSASGVLSLHADRLNVSHEVLARWLPRFADNLGMLAQLLETQAEYSRQNRQAQSLLQASQTFQQHRTIETLGQSICDSALSVTGATRAALVRWHPDSSTGVIQSVTSGHHLSKGAAVSADSLVGQLCVAGLPQVWEDAALLDQSAPVYSVGHSSHRLGSLSVVPLKQGTVVTGAIVVESELAGGVLLRDMRNVRLLGAVASVSLETVWQIEEATRRSRTDALTGLANRRAFDEALARAIAEADRFGHNVGLVICDVDNFKRVNDLYGHEVGDHVLRSVAASLATGVRGVDIVARYGGEELVMLLGKADVAMAWEVAERMRATIEAKTIGVGEHLVHVTASFGVASYPETARLGDELFPAADKALYTAKREGRNCVRFARPLASEQAGEGEGISGDGEEDE
ncbi:MAG TPA: sensor domain-containing diguanylate cyclase [Gemmatimonadaceae bacterium]|nr:sensor domain-containing diguanylate cyclase [Gemmatimonadaceae bacterium]